MKQVFISDGRILVTEVPAPLCGDNELLIRNNYSLISAGTESASLHSGSKGMTRIAFKAINNPELVNSALEMGKRDGLKKTLKVIKGQAFGSHPLGYSSSGTVIEIGKNITDIAVGDRVACAGASYANHAEIIAVPRNLVCRVPDNVDLRDAAFATIGAIAMQGIRRAKVQFGDNTVVMGLGLLGQIACQILNSAGVHVIGIDIAEDRNKLGLELGAEACFSAGKNVVDNVLNYTDNIGADSVIIYAATESSEPVKQAMQMSRKKGRIIVVGAVGMDLDRSPFYEKELDFLISCSYGPGRYDPIYEEKGIDYPIGYVRWTENRNMQEFLKMIAQKRVDVKRLTNEVFAIQEADKAYRALNAEKRPIGILFEYNNILWPIDRKVQIKPILCNKNAINVAVIGAGSFAQAYHLPSLKKISSYNLRAIVTRTGSKAKKLAEEYGAEYCTTDYKEVLNDDCIDLVLIATRHNLHAPIIVEAAKAGKHIFVEKPIALTLDDCKNLYKTITESNVNLTVGFNRRFAPLAEIAKKLAEKRKNPLMMSYRINSSGMEKNHWINDPVEGGGAILGECCHFFDFCKWIVGYDPSQIYAEMISSTDGSTVNSNNVIATIKYIDGSIATIIYTTIGNSLFPKERIELFLDKGVVAIDDFRDLTLSGFSEKGKKLRTIEKGQFNLIDEYAKLLRGEKSSGNLPSLEDGINATVCSLMVLDALKTGRPHKWKRSY